MPKTKSKTSKPTDQPPPKPRTPTKSAQIVRLLERTDGASIQELMKTTGWQAHSVRGFMAGSLKKQNKKVASNLDRGGVRRYRLEAES